MKKYYLIFFISVIFLSAQEKESLDFDVTIKIEAERPNIAIFSDRKRPEFPEIPIRKSFENEILDKYRNHIYAIEKRKKIKIADIDKEKQNIN
jgi:hypothetical protein